MQLNESNEARIDGCGRENASLPHTSLAAGMVYVYEADARAEGAGPALVQTLYSHHCPFDACSGNDFGAGSCCFDQMEAILMHE